MYSMNDKMKIPDDWTFENAEVAKHFDDHVREQLPWYEIALDMVCFLVRSYAGAGATVIDLGCSTGTLSKKLSGTIEARKINMINVDSSIEMIKKFDGVGSILQADMVSYDLDSGHDVCICFLSLMFVDVKSRKALISKLIKNTKAGGVVIIVDKIEGVGGYLGQSINRITLENKLNAGANPVHILEKELSLSGVQRPLKEQPLFNFGFKKWFQVGDFAGYIVEV